MRSKFEHLYPPTEQSLNRLWKEGLVVLDTSVLLNLYAYEQPARDQFFTVLSRVADRLWLPYRVADEYHRRRVEAIGVQRRAVSDLATKLERAVTEWCGRHPHRDKDLTAVVLDHAKALKARAITSNVTPREDAIRDRLAEFYEGRVGDCPSSEILAVWQSLGDERYPKKIPPGFKDDAKPPPDKYGDLFIWFEMLEKARNSSRDIIFVTDERKEDWWDFDGSDILGPHHQLRREMAIEAKSLYYSYRTDAFLMEAGKRFRVTTDEAQASAAAVAPIEPPRRLPGRLHSALVRRFGHEWPEVILSNFEEPFVVDLRERFPEVDFEWLATGERRRRARMRHIPSPHDWIAADPSHPGQPYTVYSRGSSSSVRAFESRLDAMREAQSSAGASGTRAWLYDGGNRYFPIENVLPAAYRYPLEVDTGSMDPTGDENEAAKRRPLTLHPSFSDRPRMGLTGSPLERHHEDEQPD